MTTIQTVIAVVFMIVAAVAALGFRDWFRWKGNNSRYLAKQSSRSPLRDEQFCIEGGIGRELAGIAGTIRANLAEYGNCDAMRITPEDSLSDFGLNYDDDVAMVVQKTGIVPGFEDYSFPLEEVATVADFVKIIARMKTEAEQEAEPYR